MEYGFWAENPHPNRMFFVKGMPPFGQRRTHHVHVRLPEDAVLETAFRDALCAHPALARDYEALKRDLALRFRYDRDGYTEQKTQFIQEALGK